MNIILDLEKHFLGKLCNYNHDWENSGFSLRYLGSKKCVICVNQRAKTYQETNKERIAEYQQVYRKLYYQKNAHKLNEQHRIYDKKNPDKVLERQRTYLLKNADKIHKRRQNHRKENADKIREQQKIYYELNRDKILERQKIYLQTPEGKNSQARGSQKRRAIKNKCHSLPYKPEDILNLFNGECAYCGSKVKLTLDHFIPITKGGSDVQGNLLPACGSCNSKKHNYDAIEWYKKQPFFDKKRLKQILKILGKTESNYDQIPLF